LGKKRHGGTVSKKKGRTHERRKRGVGKGKGGRCAGAREKTENLFGSAGSGAGSGGGEVGYGLKT